jgi:hypothetical protein
MADDLAERSLSDSQSAGGEAGKALVPQRDGELSRGRGGAGFHGCQPLKSDASSLPIRLA